MATYRKRPVEVEAFRFVPGIRMPDWFVAAFPDGMTIESMADHQWFIQIPTLEGKMIAETGDWIIQGVEGEIYPCKDSIFRQTYSEVYHDEETSR